MYKKLGVLERYWGNFGSLEGAGKAWGCLRVLGPSLWVLWPTLGCLVSARLAWGA